MPFYEPVRRTDPLVNLPLIEEEDDPSLMQTFGAAFRTENVIGSALSARGMPDAGQIEDGFDAIDYVKDDPEYAPYVESFAGILNRRAADARKEQIRQEIADRRTLDASGTWGTVAAIAAGVIDLPTLIPVGGVLGGAVRGARSGAASLGVASGIDAGISEAGLQATQATRTGEESALNIGGSVVLGGALGALLGRYMAKDATIALSRKIERQETEFDAVDREFIAGGKSAGAAARDTGPLVLKDERLISKLPIVNRQDPLIRLQLSGLDSARQTVRGLAETPLEYADNALGVATERGGSVETRIKMWNAPLAEGLQQMDTLFARYYHQVADPSSIQRRLSPALSEFDRFRGRTERLTYKQFKEEVGRAAYSGGQHAIAEVAEAARVYRQLDDAMKKAAIDARLFPEDVDVVGDISHRFRMYNRQKIIARRDEFTRILTDYFSSAQEAARFKAQELKIGKNIVQADRVRDRFDQASRRMDQLEARVGERKELRGQRIAAIEGQRAKRSMELGIRAPAGVEKLLRGADDNKAMVDLVRDARKAERSMNRKKSFAERQPVLAMIRAKGGVRIGSALHGELQAMGVTNKTHPALFKKQDGLGDIDNFVRSEDELFDLLPDDGNSYVDRNALFDAIREELAGRPLRSTDDMQQEEVWDALTKAADEWLEQVGMGPNASVKEVREYIRSVIAAEREIPLRDARISRLESELEDFDRATDALINEKEISASEAKSIADDLEKLEAQLEDVGDLANASPRVQLVVDYAKTKRDLFKAKLRERNLLARTDAIKRIKADGRANDDMLSELVAKSIDLERVRARLDTLRAKADKLQEIAPKADELEKADEFAEMLPGEIKGLVDETVNTILGHAEGRIPYDIVAGPRGALKERVLKIETAKIHDFVENDIETVMRAQFRTMAADVELSKKFGSVDLKEEIRKINDEADAKIAGAKDAAERKRLEAQRVADVRDVSAIRDRLRGTYALPANPDGIVLRAGRIARNINYVRLLGGMTISAVPDMAKVVFVHGLTSTFRDGFLPLIRNFKAVRLAGREVKMAGTALDMVLDSRVMALGDVTDDFGHHTKFERGLSALSQRFGVVSLMAPWNSGMKQFSGLVTMTNILRSAERVAAGKGSNTDIRKLAASGIDADLATRIAGQFSKHGDEQSGVLLAKAADWTDEQAREAFRAAVVRDVDRIIVTPGQDKPLWMSTELGKTVGQFKSFGVASMQRTMLAGLQQRDAATLNGTLAMLGLGALTYALKQMTAEQPLSDDPAVWAVEAFDRSGLTGWLMEANNISEKFTRGRVGFSALTGQQVSRYATRNVTGAFLGPTPEAIADIFQISGSIFAGDTTKADLKRARQLIPGQNLFYFRWLFNQAEEATGDALGLPDTRKAS